MKICVSSKPYVKEIELRINVQKVGPTLLLVREKPTFKPAGGIGVAFRRKCASPPPSTATQGEPLGNGLSNGIYRMVSEMDFGGMKILLADEVDAAEYPPKTAWTGGYPLLNLGY